MPFFVKFEAPGSRKIPALRQFFGPSGHNSFTAKALALVRRLRWKLSIAE
jgi:hypothetical protein